MRKETLAHSCTVLVKLPVGAVAVKLCAHVKLYLHAFAAFVWLLSL